MGELSALMRVLALTGQAREWPWWVETLKPSFFQPVPCTRPFSICHIQILVFLIKQGCPKFPQTTRGFMSQEVWTEVSQGLHCII